MAFEEDETVILHDEHSEYDGQAGTVSQVMETMFGDATYTIEFPDGREQGVPEDALEAAPDAEDEPSAADEDESDAEVDPSAGDEDESDAEVEPSAGDGDEPDAEVEPSAGDGDDSDDA